MLYGIEGRECNKESWMIHGGILRLCKLLADNASPPLFPGCWCPKVSLKYPI